LHRRPPSSTGRGLHAAANRAVIPLVPFAVFFAQPAQTVAKKEVPSPYRELASAMFREDERVDGWRSPHRTAVPHLSLHLGSCSDQNWPETAEFRTVSRRTNRKINDRRPAVVVRNGPSTPWFYSGFSLIWYAHNRTCAPGVGSVRTDRSLVGQG
jgi:hypothetical protein